MFFHIGHRSRGQPWIQLVDDEDQLVLFNFIPGLCRFRTVMQQQDVIFRPGFSEGVNSQLRLLVIAPPVRGRPAQVVGSYDARLVGSKRWVEYVSWSQRLTVIRRWRYRRQRSSVQDSLDLDHDCVEGIDVNIVADGKSR